MADQQDPVRTALHHHAHRVLGARKLGVPYAVTGLAVACACSAAPAPTTPPDPNPAFQSATAVASDLLHALEARAGSRPPRHTAPLLVTCTTRGGSDGHKLDTGDQWLPPELGKRWTSTIGTARTVAYRHGYTHEASRDHHGARHHLFADATGNTIDLRYRHRPTAVSVTVVSTCQDL